MPSRARHLRAAERNERLAFELLKAAEWPEWSLVVAFYAALHLVDAFLAGAGLHPRSHSEREQYVARVAELRPVFIPYRRLSEESRSCRYEAAPFSTRQAGRAIEQDYAAIRSHLEPTAQPPALRPVSKALAGTRLVAMKYDAIVVGGGPSGSTTAYHLSRAGAKVLVLDRARFPRDKPCGGGVTGRAFAAAPVDLTPVIEQEMTRVRFSYRLGGFFDYSYPKTLVYMTQRKRLDAFLLEQAAWTGAEVREGVLVRSVEAENGGARVRVGEEVIEAGVLVGADGANGLVAKSLGLEPAPEAAVALEAEFLYEGECPADWRDMLALELGSMDGGYGWSFPKADHFNVGCGGWKSVGGKLRSHLGALTRHYGLDPASISVTKGHHLPTRTPGRPIVRRNAILVGDAAGLVDPMSGEGLYSAFVSGRIAAASIREYLDGHRPDLQHYEEAIEREIMDDIRASSELRDAYHFTPLLYVGAMRYNEYLRRSLCQIMLGEKTYEEFLSALGPLRLAMKALGGIGRRMRQRRVVVA